MFTRSTFTVLTTCSVLALASAAHAQSTSEQAGGENQIVEAVSAQDEAGAGAGEIVVTANKREQRLNDVGQTISVLGGDALKTQQINSVADLANTIPSLSFSNSANGTPIYTLRGVGFAESSLAAYPTVSIYVDEVPLPFPVLTTHTAFDLDRVEVLKGPQGTLFGQNATGGAINYIAAKPTDTFAAGANVSYGRFNQVIGEAFISGPLADTLSARLAGRIERQDGWQQSNSRPGDRNGNLRNYMGRLLINFEPTSGARFLLNLNASQDRSETQAPQYIGFAPQNPIVSPNIANAAFSPQRPRSADWTPGLPFRNNRQLQASLRGDIDILDNLTLTSITSYIDFKQRQRDDGDGLPAVSLDLFRNDGKIESFSQEVRLSNGAAGAFRWIVGGNYEKSSVDQEIYLLYPDSSATATLGAVLGYPFTNTQYDSRQRMENFAGFGNVELDIGEKITLKGGARYTKSKITQNQCSTDPTGLPRETGPLFFDILLGGAFGPYNGQCYAINTLGFTLNGVPNGAPGAYVDSLKEDNISYRVGVDFKPRPGLLFYANVAKGYKAGGFPVVSASTFSQYLPVTQESVLAYEAGFKASLLDRALQLNGAAFYYDYKDKQLRSKTVDPTFGILDILQNIPKSTVKGFELEAVIRPASNLVFNLAFTYIDAKIDQFTGVNAGGVTANFAGADVPYTPKYQVGTNVDWNLPVGNDYEIFAGSSLNFRSDTVAVIGGNLNPNNLVAPVPRVFEIDSYATLDLRLGLQAPDNRWRVWVWGKNVTNTYYFNNVVAVFDTVSRYAGMPRTYGLSASVNF